MTELMERAAELTQDVRYLSARTYNQDAVRSILRDLSEIVGALAYRVELLEERLGGESDSPPRFKNHPSTRYAEDDPLSPRYDE